MAKINFDITPQGPYFSILRAAIWNKPVETNTWPEYVDFKSIIENFKAQAMLPFVSNVLLTLPEPFSLSENQSNDILSYVGNNIQGHYKIRKAIVEVFTALENAGCHPILLKGEGLAQLYPQPNLRSVGDIDLFVLEDEYSIAIKTMIELCGYSADDNQETDYHYHISYGDTIVEIHHAPAFCGNVKYNLEYLTISKKWLIPGICEDIFINNKRILVPHRQYNVFYVFNHLCQHWNNAVGLRQFVDLMYIIEHNFKDISLPELLKMLKTTGLKKAWDVVVTLLAKYFGLDVSQVAYKPLPNKDVNFIVKDIIYNGNFGTNRESENIFDIWHNFRGIKNAYYSTMRVHVFYKEESFWSILYKTIIAGTCRIYKREC